MISLLPDGTFTTFLSNLQGVSNENQKTIEAMARKGDWAGVAEFAEKNIAKERRIADWWVVAGIAYAQMGQFDKANARFAEAVRMEPGEMEYRNLLALSQRLGGEPERALRTLNEALRVNNENPDTFFLIGETYMALGQPARAVPAYEKAMTLLPDAVEIWYGLGLAYAKLGRTDDFREVEQRLRSVDPRLAAQLVAAAGKPAR
ncbi:MAG: tetratricopeptide repeat protein [Burkholderiales bacterium]|nr:tetratricopeptide repeat protein [Burkholderiales bacterium]